MLFRAWPSHGNDTLLLLLSLLAYHCVLCSFACCSCTSTAQTYGSQKLKWEKAYLNVPQRLWNGMTMPVRYIL